MTADEFPSPISDFSPSLLGDQIYSLNDLLKSPTAPIQRTPTCPLLSPIFIAGTSPNFSFYISGASPKTPSDILVKTPLQASAVLGTQPVISSDISDISPIDSPSQHILEDVSDTAFSLLETTSEVSTQVTSILDIDTVLSLAASPPPAPSSKAKRSTSLHIPNPISFLILTKPPSLLDMQVHATQDLTNRLFKQKQQLKRPISWF